MIGIKSEEKAIKPNAPKDQSRPSLEKLEVSRDNEKPKVPDKKLNQPQDKSNITQSNPHWDGDMLEAPQKSFAIFVSGPLLLIKKQLTMGSDAIPALGAGGGVQKAEGHYGKEERSRRERSEPDLER